MKRKLDYGPIPPEGKPRVSLRIRLPECTVTAGIASKSVRVDWRRLRWNSAVGAIQRTDDNLRL